MAKVKEAVNPFYVLLVIAGTAFLITACAYELMAVRAMHPQVGRIAAADAGAAGQAQPGEHTLMAFLDEHGVELMTWELIALGLTTAAAMSLDQYRWRRHAARQLASRDAQDSPEIS